MFAIAVIIIFVVCFLATPESANLLNLFKSNTSNKTDLDTSSTRFLSILYSLSEKQFSTFEAKLLPVLKCVSGTDAIATLYPEIKALSDFSKEKKYSATGNTKNYNALLAYCETLTRALEADVAYTNNATIHGPGFGIISTSAADTMLYGALAAQDINKQVRRINQTSKAFFDSQVKEARKQLFSQTKV